MNIYYDNKVLYVDIEDVLDSNMNEIGRTITHWNNLTKFHMELIKRGINTHHGDNWMPKVINLDLD